MAREIERKFLVQGEDWRQQVVSRLAMRQGYLGGDRVSVRVRLCANQAWLNIKSREMGVSRSEFEYPIPVDEARELLENHIESAVVSKDRHLVPVGSHTFEIDEFKGDNQGLIVAEIELKSADEHFPRPPWLGREVTDELRYYNNALARHPYCQWGAPEGKQ